MPNAFTPNEDGKADYFQIERKYVNNYHLSIFSRWGDMVFESRDENYRWDGKYKNEYVPAWLYLYIISGVDLKGRVYNEPPGTLTVIR